MRTRRSSFSLKETIIFMYLFLGQVLLSTQVPQTHANAGRPSLTNRYYDLLTSNLGASRHRFGVKRPGATDVRHPLRTQSTQTSGMRRYDVRSESTSPPSSLGDRANAPPQCPAAGRCFPGESSSHAAG